ncbi:F-box only protein, putative [Entamoeba invadens IP1]|uniref:F-box only protein, putative n=2 Tax=Entamoeba invadens TaxID=33085 RepID=A0A0A1TXN0_ENTIV|nr:F-box only protein, putative [Entamoeba invadens IP1]ELP86115.1 F-box only protein, putative [Entamoeba invadens IP1]BAN41160.1 F-box only protein, putative [Entamoeba invadens]|eukprot:XP_004185461.1 F-box only protein, putative [Entamoeba invadens IP1]
MGNKASKRIKVITVNAAEAKHKTLAEVVRLAPPLSIILVKQGTYDESEKILIDKPIQIIGVTEGKQKPIISSARECIEIDCPDKVMIKGLDLRNNESKVVLDIKRGEACVDSCDISNAEDGVSVTHSAKLMITNSRIWGCSKAGLHCGGKDTRCISRNVQIFECMTGVAIFNDANPLISVCNITQCGIGLFVSEKGRGCITDTLISGNKKPGVLTHSGGNPVLNNTKILDGSSNGVFVRSKGRGVFVGCEISKNNLPGIASCEGGEPLVVGGQICEGRNAGVFVYDNGKGIFSGCQIKDNMMPGIEVRASGNPIVVGCEVSRGQSNGIYVHNKGTGLFAQTKVNENTLPGVAVRTSGDPILCDCELVAGKDNALFVSDKGKGVVLNTLVEGCSAQPMVIQDGQPLMVGCSVVDGKKNNVQAWINNIPEGLGLLEEDVPDFSQV